MNPSRLPELPDAICPVCGDIVWAYRLATPEDQRAAPGGMATICTGPRHVAAHNCRGDHAPINTPDMEPRE